MNWAQQVFSAGELAGVLASTSICFDLSIFEIFAPLGKGGTVIVADSALQLPELRAAHRVTLLNTVPSAAAALLKEEGIPASVHTINLAGEPLPGQLVRQLYERESVRRVLNLYGPTEDTTYSTYAQVERERVAPPHIGRPVGGKQIYILNRYLLPVPIGIRGELYIGGGGLARGYLRRPALTAEKFIPNPFSVEPGARLYKTGDWARYLPDGNIEFLGRTDQQVKLRGFRIELGEVEAALEEHQGVRAAAVIVREYERGDRRLVAYVAAREEGSVSVRELRGFVKKRLPEYMIPSAFVLLDALPLTPNGKIDRRALPAPGGGRSVQETAYTAPRTEIEKMLAEIWAQVLRVERVSRDDNFFELGGHSLLATQVFSRLRVSTGLDVPLLAMFEAPTIAELSERVGALGSGPEGGPRPSPVSST